MTKKDKLESFDRIKAERDKLALAVFDLAGNSRFPFKHAVRVNCETEVDGNYPDHIYRVSVSERSMPYWMVEAYGYDGKVASVAFWTETELETERDNQSIYWRMMRHAIWKISRKKAEIVTLKAWEEEPVMAGSSNLESEKA